MKKLESDKLMLPTVYFITDRKEIRDVPIGVPFIFGDANIENSLIRIMEYEVLYDAAKKSGYPFDFKKILLDNGYKDLKSFGYHHPVYMEYTSEGLDLDEENPSVLKHIDKYSGEGGAFTKYMTDSAAYVDIEKLKDLNVFPIWLNTIEDAVHTNIHNFAMFNPNMYCKKLDGMYGALEMISPNRNLIIIDVSSSIPKAVSSTCLALAKNLCETFYADIMITGSKTTLYEYENIRDLNINTIYEENGMSNDQKYFKALVTGLKRKYHTAIVFGDNDSPCYYWNTSTKYSIEEGQKICQWEVEKLISFHTSGTRNIAAYGSWFTPKTTTKIADWVKYLNK